MAADRHPRASARRLRASAAARTECAQPAPRSTTLWETLELALRHRHRAHQRRAGPPARSVAPGRCGLRRPGSRGQRLSRAARALSADRGRHSRRRHLRGPARGVLDERDAALCAQGGHGRGPAFQPDRPGPGGTRRPEPHARRARGRGRSHPGPRNGRAGRRPGPALHVGAVEVFLAQGARLRLVNIQNWDEATWHFSRERALVGRDASLQWTVGGLGSRLAKVNQEVALAGQGASAQVNGVMFTTGRQHLAYFTRQDHIAPHTTSDLLYKGGLKDQVADRLEGDDPRREGRPAHRRLSEKRQPGALGIRPRRLDPRPGDRSQRRALHPRRDRRAASTRR